MTTMLLSSAMSAAARMRCSSCARVICRRTFPSFRARYAIVLAGSIRPQTDSTAEVPQQVHRDRREKPRPPAHHRRGFCSTGSRTADPAFAPATLSLAPSPCRGCQDPERAAPRWRGDKRTLRSRASLWRSIDSDRTTAEVWPQTDLICLPGSYDWIHKHPKHEPAQAVFIFGHVIWGM